MDFVKVILTSLLSVISLFLIAKVLGHKQMSQLDFFDYITGITIGSVAAELATELEQPWKPLTAMIIYGGATYLLSMITGKLPRTRKFINGSPTILLDNGKLYRDNLKKAKLDLSEFMVMCRQEGYFDLREIQTAVFEYNGRLTVLPVSDKRPLNPADMGLTPAAASISTEIIMDGAILGENLQRMGVDEIWLQRQLKEQGYHSAREIFLGLCDDNKNVTLFPLE
ncbi:MAG: DUF421 domain-containing protein [Clostridia bacterium]|nr:DUF421 domain-containing protein [Clostridia bacterium]